MLLRTPSGKPHRVIGSLRDISDRKAAEQELLQLQESTGGVNQGANP
jgi:PAS domain-containing protein